MREEALRQMDIQKPAEEHAVMEMPLRSRLYHLSPFGAGTLWAESLTSYVNRLAWMYRVSPRVLVAQEIDPLLSSEYQVHSFAHLATYSRSGAMGINGTGNLAVEWSTSLERLTMRSDLHLLTLHSWVGDLTSHGHMRRKPAWCPLCYTEWREQKLPVYQPLLWMLQLVTMCPQHQVQLEDRCPYCQKYQSILARNTAPGYCTQCHTWLGKPLDAVVDQETLHWQEWVMHSLEELRGEYGNVGVLPWQQFFTNLAACLKEWGICSKLADLTGFSRDVFYLWIGRKHRAYSHRPSLETIFEFCYACNVTPLQVMTTPDAFRQNIQKETPSRHLRPHRFIRNRVDREQCLELIHAMLDGREEPLGMYHIAKRLGHSQRVLFYHFPQECELITQQAQEYRKQRKELRVARVCEEVRPAVITLHVQGIFPSHRKVRTLLSDPNLIRMPEASDAWHAARRELGIEQ
jgi:TniQ